MLKIRRQVLTTTYDFGDFYRVLRFFAKLSNSSVSTQCQLTHKDVEWQWGQEQEDPFMKVAVTQAPTLRHFSPHVQTEGQGDASQNGLRFLLLQEGQPVTYASRALTSAQ